MKNPKHKELKKASIHQQGVSIIVLVCIMLTILTVYGYQCYAQLSIDGEFTERKTEEEIPEPARLL
jgi:hypothetical protein